MLSFLLDFRLKVLAGMVVFGVLFSLFVGRELRIRDLEREWRAEKAYGDSVTYEILNLAALHDSTRKILTDSLSTTVARLVVQKQDSTTVKTSTTAKIKDKSGEIKEAFNGTNLIAALDTGVVIKFKHRIDDAPLHMDLDFTLDSASIEVKYEATFDPMHINSEIRCGVPDNRGIRRAELLIKTPEYLSLVIDTVAQTYRVCNPPQLQPTKETRKLMKYSLIGTTGFILGAFVHGQFKK